MNSIKFTQKGIITLIVSKERNPEIIRFTVQDTGVGIEKCQLEFLNKCLRSKDFTTLQFNSKGSFLGLLISHKLATKLISNNIYPNGLEIQSIEGKGSSFSFIIDSISKNTTVLGEDFENEINLCNYLNPPIFDYSSLDISSSLKEIFIEPFPEKIYINNTTNNVQTKDTINTNTSIQIKKRNDILIVDDDPFNLLSLEMLFSKMELLCEKAFDGEEAIAKILDSKNKFKLIIIDYCMPKLDGVQATIKLKHLMKNNIIDDIPIYGCTTYNTKEIKEECIEAGMKELLTKPVKFADLEKLINKEIVTTSSI